MHKLIDPIIFYGVKDWVEENIKWVLGIPASDGISLNDAWPDGTIDKRQKTGMITVFLSQLFEKGIYEMLKEAGFKVKRKADSSGDITINGQAWEIKTSQGKDMQGATHSAQKPPRYIMIKYKLDYDKVLSLENNDGFIIEFGVWISESIDNNWWSGEATSNNSTTILRIPIANGNQIDTLIGEFNDSYTHGRKYCALINEVI